MVWIEISFCFRFVSRLIVTTFAVVWIEMHPNGPESLSHIVTTFAVVLIEIENTSRTTGDTTSPPSRWCGLKYLCAHTLCYLPPVTTFAVVWIEID